jgi:hypothetical protein
VLRPVRDEVETIVCAIDLRANLNYVLEENPQASFVLRDLEYWRI